MRDLETLELFTFVTSPARTVRPGDALVDARRSQEHWWRRRRRCGGGGGAVGKSCSKSPGKLDEGYKIRGTFALLLLVKPLHPHPSLSKSQERDKECGNHRTVAGSLRFAGEQKAGQAWSILIG